MTAKSLNSNTSYKREFALKQAAHTDVGKRRSENQDSYGFAHTKETSFYIIADGMGGAKGGATASAIAVEVIPRLSFDDQGKVTEQSIHDAITKTNKIIFEHSKTNKECEGMGTTIVVLAIVGKKAIVAHVGDSRIYRFKNSELLQITKDHSLLQELIDSGSISGSEEKSHPMGHVLTRSLGPLEEVEIDIQTIEIDEGDRFLLCCDGLTNHAENQEIEEFCSKEKDLEALSRTLIDKALSDGGSDNISVLTFSIEKLSSKDTFLINQLNIPEIETETERKLTEDEISNFINGSQEAENGDQEPELFEEIEDDEVELITEPWDEEERSRAPLLMIVLFVLFAVAAAMSLYQQREQKNFAPLVTKEGSDFAKKIAKKKKDKKINQQNTSLFTWQEEKVEADKPNKNDAIVKAADRVSVDFYNDDNEKEPILLTPEEKFSIIKSKRELKERLRDYDLKLLMLNFKRQSDALAEINSLREKSQIKLKQFEQIRADSKKAKAAYDELVDPRSVISKDEKLELAKKLSKNSNKLSYYLDLYFEQERVYENSVAAWKRNPNNNQLASIMGAKGRELKSATAELERALEKKVDELRENLRKSLIDSEILLVDLQEELSRQNRHIGFWSAFRPVPKRLRREKRREIKKKRKEARAKLNDLQYQVPDLVDRGLRERRVALSLGL